MEQRLWLIATVVILINALSQLLVSSTADQDQAGELLRSQWWAWGYGSQPPIYTWIVKTIFIATGPSLWALQAIKVFLLSTLIAAILGIGQRLNFSPNQQLISICGFTLIPQFLWESQRDLTHSVLASVIAALTVLQWLILERHRTWWNYGIAGILVAAGMLAKYNYLLLLGGLLLASSSLFTYRRILIDRRTLFAVLLACVLLSPHLIWVLSHPDVALGGLDKLKNDPAILSNRVMGLLNALSSAFRFLTPLWIAALILLMGRTPRDVSRQPGEELLLRLPLFIGILLLIVILTTGATRIKDRWYQSLLVTTPVLVASLAGKDPPSRRRHIVAALSGSAVIISSLLLPGRTVLAGQTRKISRPNLPLPELLRSIRAEGFPPQVILTSDNFLAGNARLIFPEARILSSRSASLATVESLPGLGTQVLVLRSTATDQESLPKILQAFQIDATGFTIQSRTWPLHWAPKKTYSLEWTRLQLPILVDAQRDLHG